MFSVLVSHGMHVCMDVPSVMWKTLVIVVLEQLYTWSFLFAVFAYTYVTDEGFAAASSIDNRGTSAYVVILLCVAGAVSLAVRLFTSMLKRGVSRAIAEFHHAQFIDAGNVAAPEFNAEIFLDITTVVGKGYMTIFPLTLLVSFFFILLYFLYTTNPQALFVPLMYVLSVCCFSCCRGKVYAQRVAEEARASVLASDFEELCELRDQLQTSEMWNGLFIPFLTLLLLLSYVLLFANRVGSGDMTLGAFLSGGWTCLLLGVWSALMSATLLECSAAVLPVLRLIPVVNGDVSSDKESADESS